MQTYLPFPDFGLSTACLDDRRLLQQRIEAHFLYYVIKDGKENWKDQPIFKMWRGHLPALAWYHNLAVSRLLYRGLLSQEGLDWLPLHTGYPILFPSWIGNRAFHRSHQSNLLRKDEAH